MFYSSDVSDVFLQSIFKLNDEKNKVTSITISDSQKKKRLDSVITTNSGADTLTHD